MKWFADNSELHSLNAGKIPDVLLFGGVIVSHAGETKICKTLEQVKHAYGHHRAPVKWNFKDLRKIYEKHNSLDLYQKFSDRSKEWRRDLFESVKNEDFSIIVAAIQMYSKDRKIIKKKKDDVVRYVFSNALMRYALHVQESKPDSAQIVLDWPDKSKSRPFDEEYASAYRYGRTVDRGASYNSGPLCDLGFVDSALFTNMHHSTLLQFADLVVGATRELVECSIGKKETGFGVDMAQVLRSRYRGAPDNIYRRGICVSTGNPELSMQIESGIEKFLRPSTACAS